jgi:transcriptional regulator NrdR family protein
MKNKIIDSDALEAARVYDAFVTAMTYRMFSKDAVQLVINTLTRKLKQDYSEDFSNVENKKMIQHYIKYLKSLI